MKKWFHFGSFTNLSLVKNLFWWSFAAWVLLIVNSVLNWIHARVLPSPAESTGWIIQLQNMNHYIFLLLVLVLLRLGCEVIYKIINHTSPQNK
ncbi:MAG: hypothetical protein LKJ17_11900 [Oscillospiraceae bacterium]|jgi:ABC-type multidrug transport system fused ATPase/permease subunit|nr:hypothetical protein [Oscillospiraceae bacterium]